MAASYNQFDENSVPRQLREVLAVTDEQQPDPGKIGRITKVARQQLKKTKQQEKKQKETGEDIPADVREYWNTPLTEEAIEAETRRLMAAVTDAASPALYP